MELFEKSSGIVKSFDGSSIYFESRGEGECLVFVYGIACLTNHWHHQIKYFSKNFRVITFDLRGHHQSNPITNPQNINIASAAKDIEVILDHLKIPKAHFIGHSFGAPVIFSAYDQFPEKFKSITLINGFAKNPIKGMFGLDVVEPFFHYFKKQFQESPVLFTQLWKWAVYNPVSMRAVALVGGFNIKLTHFKDIEVYARGVAQLDLNVFLSFFEDMMSFNGEKVLKKIDVPTLIISGEEDNVTPKSFQIEMASQIKGAELVTVPYGSHCTQLDFPDYINLKIEKFVR
ncbi:MAG: alpha/beta hydrolase [Bdellovibrionaceae bacterium]|nr:alpha/beta hydrolase [Pseudobdellovibrionaceae bacterium]NUM59582.1 alpha/beta hydrolase [Pseudobdellovibrionaceae bacterium]